MNYLVISEMIFFAAYSFFIYEADAATRNIFLLIGIIYACLKLLFYIFYDKKVSKALCAVSLVLSCISLFFFYPMALFFPISLNQVNAVIIKKGWLVSTISLVWLFILPTSFILIYLLVFGFSVLIFGMQQSTTQKTAELNAKIEKLNRNHNNIKEQLENYNQAAESITYQSQLEERNKLSQALHDELGHTLSGNILRLEAIKYMIGKNSEKSTGMLQEVIENLRSGMDSIRNILKSAKPEISTVNIASMQAMIDNVKTQSDVNIKLKYNSDISEISQGMWQAIIPNIKESLTNMMKYSGADNCEIQFAKHNKFYRVSIKDDGSGCKNIVKGLGMAGIEERMAALNGQAIFDSTSGFSVTMIFPL